MVEIHNPKEDKDAIYDDVEDPVFDEEGNPESFMYQNQDGEFYEVEATDEGYKVREFGRPNEANQEDIGLQEALDTLGAEEKSFDKALAQSLD